MKSYRELYFFLYGKIADALEQIEDQKKILGVQTLQQALLKAEEAVMEMDEVPENGNQPA